MLPEAYTIPMETQNNALAVVMCIELSIVSFMVIECKFPLQSLI